MAKVIEIGVGSETKAFKQGIDSGVIAPLENAQEAIEDLGRDRGPEQLERNLENAQEATEHLQREVVETAESIERNFRQAYRAQKESAEDAAHTSSEVMGEVKNEALQNASEVFSSFDGSAQSFVDGIQGTFGGLVASLGVIKPSLIPVGIAGAAAVGLIAAAIGNSEQKAQEFKDRVAELTQEFLDTGTIGKRSFTGMSDALKDIVAETDDSKVNLKDLQKIAETLGRPIRDVAYAYVQGGDALDALIDRQMKLQAAEDDRYRAALENNPNNLLYGIDTQKALGDVNNLLTEQKKALDAATEGAKLAADAGLSAWQLKADLIGQVNDAYDDAAGSVQDYIDEETGLFDVARYIKAMEAREQALREYQATLAAADLTPEAVKFLESQGQDAAAAFLAGYKDATPAQKAELNRIWTQAGKDDSAAYTNAISGAFENATISGPSVELPNVNVNGWMSSLQRELEQRQLKVRIEPVDKYGKRLY